MARKVTVASVANGWLTTRDGERLRIIGNWNPKPGGIAYTDGVIVYGYSLPGYVAPPRKKAKPLLFAPFFAFGTDNTATDEFSSCDVFAYDFDANGVQENIKLWGYTPIEWYWSARGITFANTRDRAFVREDHYVQNVAYHRYIDNDGNTFIPDYTDACVLAIDKDCHFMAQTGDYRQIQRATSLSWWDRYGVHTASTTSPYDWLGTGDPLRGTEHDLSYETDSTSNKSGNVTSVLDSVFGYINSDLALKQGTPPSYPTTAPSPALLDMALYQDKDFCFRTSWTGADAYGDRRMECCGDAPPVIWMLVSAVAYGGTHTENGHTGWWPIVYRYKIGVQCREHFNGYDIVYWNVEAADYIEGANLMYLNFSQIEHTETGYKVSYNGYEWKNGTLTHGNSVVATIPTRPFGVFEQDGSVHVLTATNYYIIKGNTVTTRAIHTDSSYHQYIYSDNGSLCPIDNVQKIADAYEHAYY